MNGRSAAIVGLTVGRSEARWGPWSGAAFLLAEAYISAVERAGAAAIMVPGGRAVTETPALVLDRIDALVLTGGCDVDPGSYGQAPQRETGPVDRRRDVFEVELVRAAFARDLPVLATCRGMQVMNVAFGGTLHQHLAGGAGEAHRRREGEFTRHRVALAPGSLAARAAGEEHPVVDSHHHQAVDRVGPNFVVSGRAGDGLVEAIEDPSRTFALGVQWHPEEDDASRLIASLVARVAIEMLTRCSHDEEIGCRAGDRRSAKAARTASTAAVAGGASGRTRVSRPPVAVTTWRIGPQATVFGPTPP